MTNKIFGYDFKAEADSKSADIYIYGEIGWDCVSSQIAKDIAEFKGDSLNIRINSGGGSVFEGFAIFNAIKRFEGAKTAFIEGMAGSAASYVMLACDKIKCYENATVFIHNPLVDWASGNAEQLKKTAEDLERLQKTFVSEYVKKTGKDENEIIIAMDAETLFTAQAAKDFGLVDEIITDEKEEKASVSRKFKYVASYFAAQSLAEKPRTTKKQKCENNKDNTMAEKTYEKWSDAIADLEAFLALSAEERTDEELQSIIDGLKKFVEVEPTEEDKAKQEAEAKLNAAIAKALAPIQAQMKAKDDAIAEMQKKQDNILAIGGFAVAKANEPKKIRSCRDAWAASKQ